MEQAFEVIQPGDVTPRLQQAADRTSPAVQALVPGRLVYLDAGSPENVSAPSGWQHVTFRRIPADSGVVGWIESIFVGPAHEFKVLPVDEDAFVRACGRAEIQSSAGSTTGAPAILADYLIALAWIESELVRFENRLPGTTAVGPFQITTDEWADFLTVNADAGYAPFQLYQALAQVAAAQFLAQRDWDVLETEAKNAGLVEVGQTYVPSFLLLFQSRLVGPRAAFAIDRIHATGEAQTPVSTALEPFFPDAEARQSLIKRRQRYLQQQAAGTGTTVDEFVEKTSAILSDGFTTAFSKLKQHFSEFAIPPAAEDAPWLEFARQEETFWKQADVREDTTKGQERIREYFSATEFHPDSVEPWCGAFVAWCLSKAARPIVKEAAAAISWTAWGTVELRKGGLTDPTVAAAIPGAIVVLHPSEGTGTTGHVCFALNRMESSTKLKGLGGNQSDTVRTDPFDISRVASIRALTRVEMPDGDGQLIMARTVYGEARGEPREGQEAVAEVIANRAASGRYPGTISGVCLQASQFSCWNASDPNRKKIVGLQPHSGDEDFDRCFEIAGAVLAGPHRQLSSNVLNYYADYISKPTWVLRSPHAVMERKIGRHLFYSGID